MRFELSATDSLHAVAIQPDGKIVGAGSIGGVDYFSFLVLRVGASGGLDASFADGGFAEVPVRDDAGARGIALQPNGKIVVAGRATEFDENFPGGARSFFALIRLSPLGVLDPSFAGDGTVTTSFHAESSDDGRAVDLKPDGRIVVTGGSLSVPYGPTGFATARYLGDAPVSPGLVRGGAWRLSNDFDGDGDTPWFDFGQSTDRPIVGDWDGDDDEEPGIVRGNRWYLSNEAPSTASLSFLFASASDRPMAGDWDGNGTWTPAAVRGNVWYVTNANPPTSIAHTFAFAKASDRPVAGDWDGNGRWTPGVVRGNTWYVSNQMPPQTVESFQFGKVGDFPVVGDWDGDGAWTPGVVRGNVWYLTNEIAPDSIYASFVFGKTSDRFVVGDWDVL